MSIHRLGRDLLPQNIQKLLKFKDLKSLLWCLTVSNIKTTTKPQNYWRKYRVNLSYKLMYKKFKDWKYTLLGIICMSFIWKSKSKFMFYRSHGINGYKKKKTFINLTTYKKQKKRKLSYASLLTSLITTVIPIKHLVIFCCKTMWRR